MACNEKRASNWIQIQNVLELIKALEAMDDDDNGANKEEIEGQEQNVENELEIKKEALNLDSRNEKSNELLEKQEVTETEEDLDGQEQIFEDDLLMEQGGPILDSRTEKDIDQDQGTKSEKHDASEVVVNNDEVHLENWDKAIKVEPLEVDSADISIAYQANTNLELDHVREEHDSDYDMAPWFDEQDCTCVICGMIFSTQEDMDDHSFRIHKITKVNVGNLTCDICGKTVSSAAYLKIHKENRHSQQKIELNPHPGVKSTDPGDALTCIVCEATLANKFELQHHHNTTHNNQKIQHMNQNLIRDIPIESTICDICGKVCPTQNHMRRHRLYKHSMAYDEKHAPMDTCKCNICGKTYSNVRHMRRHRRETHTQEEIEQAKDPDYVKDDSNDSCTCNVCGKTYTTKYQMRYHREKKHTINEIRNAGSNPKTFEYDETLESCVCIVCGKTYKNKYIMKYHRERTHTSEEIEEAKLKLRIKVDQVDQKPDYSDLIKQGYGNKE